MPPPVVKRNTVDLIASKTSYETVLPVHVLPTDEAYEAFLQRCKPFDIIDGRNPFDEPTPTAGPTASPHTTGESGLTTTSTSSRRRHRSASPNPSTTRRGVAKKEQPDDPFDVRESPFAQTPSRLAPPRKDWAKTMLAATTPYALSTLSDDYRRVGYMLDSADYAWCRTQRISPVALQHGITFLEWRYVQHILQRATSAAELARGTAERDAQQQQQHQARRTARANAAGKSGSASDASRCAVCARAVEFAQSFDEDSVSVIPGVNSLVGIRCQECGAAAHLQCWYLTELPRAHGAWVCDACSAATRGGRKRQHQRCVICSRTGGVLITYRGHQAVGTSVAANGSPTGVSSSSSSPSAFAAALESGPGTAVAASHLYSPVSSPTTPSAWHHGTTAESLCHVVCALAFPELAVEAPVTQVRRNGLVDMAYRPFVYALRRIAKQRYPMNCGYCHQEGGICLICHHPRCFEAMHPACAAEAHAVECSETVAKTETEHTSSAFLSTALPGATGAPAVAKSRSITAAEASPSSSLQHPWSQCHVYCLKHFGVTLSYSLGSAALGQEAESGARTADLTGVLTTQQDVFATGSSVYPEAQKRGRGRPPVALVKQREEELGLIEKVKEYWLHRRQERRRESAQLVPAINTLKTTSILAAACRPELIKIAPTKVRLSHFMCLVPEWQQYLVMHVEGELPLPDEEYEDAQRYRKNHAPHTRRSGNTAELCEKLKLVKHSADLFCDLSQLVAEGCAQRTKEVELITHAFELQCQWKK